jgi:hypothetical protein
MNKWAFQGVYEKPSFRYGQLSQDFFVNKLLNINEGFFLDIGAGVGGLRLCPVHTMSNTYGLEKNRQWQGIAIDYDETYIEIAKKERSCKLLCVDLMENNINDLLEQNNCPREIDYLSFDVDDAQEKVFNEFDFEKYRFRIITYEHNSFTCGKHRQESRDRFEKLGYHVLFGNVGREPNDPVEDWYVDVDLFLKYNKISDTNLSHHQIIELLETQKI